MIVYQTDRNGYYVGPVKADPSPLEKGVWLIPGGAVEQEPPTLQEGERAKWANGEWEVIPPPEPEPEPEPEPIPQFITFRQLVLGTMSAGWVSPAEAEAWASRSALPTPVTATIAKLPEAERPAARITALTMSGAYRNDALLFAAARAAMPGATEQEVNAALDQAFREWSAL